MCHLFGCRCVKAIVQPMQLCLCTRICLFHLHFTRTILVVCAMQCTYAVRIWYLRLFFLVVCMSLSPLLYVHTMFVCVCPYVADAFFLHTFFFLSALLSVLFLQCLCLLVVRIHSGFIELTLTLNEFLLVNFFFFWQFTTECNRRPVYKCIYEYIYYSTLFAIVFFFSSFFLSSSARLCGSLQCR